MENGSQSESGEPVYMEYTTFVPPAPDPPELGRGGNSNSKKVHFDEPTTPPPVARSGRHARPSKREDAVNERGRQVQEDEDEDDEDVYMDGHGEEYSRVFTEFEDDEDYYRPRGRSEDDRRRRRRGRYTGWGFWMGFVLAAGGGGMACLPLCFGDTTRRRGWYFGGVSLGLLFFGGWVAGLTFAVKKIEQRMGYS